MSTELELAPPIEVVETTEDDLDIPEMVAHLYLQFEGRTLCGIAATNDPHNRMHKVEKLRNAVWKPGSKECSACGAPACEKCYALASTRSGQ